MIVVPCYGHNVYIDSKLVGYISELDDGDAAIYVSGNKFARLTAEGIVLISGKRVGEIDDAGDVYLNGKLVGEITPQNDIRLFSEKLNG